MHTLVAPHPPLFTAHSFTSLHAPPDVGAGEGVGEADTPTVCEGVNVTTPAV